MAMIQSGTAFGKALCEHFGIPAKQVMCDLTVNTKQDEVFGASLTIMLTPDDLAGIARRMGATPEPGNKEG